MTLMAPETPYIAIDRKRLITNIDRAAQAAKDAGISLRPHVKTHKMIEIARTQMEAGAIGITVATLGEAEVFVAAGFSDVFIAYPLWLTATKAQRLTNLLSEATIRLGVDSAESGHRLSELLGERAREIQLVIEVDSGHHRSGIAPEDAGQLAVKLSSYGLSVTGVFTFPGHSYAPGALSAAAEDESRALAVAFTQLRDAGIVEADIRSGGSTPSLSSADASVVSEQRPGVYVFNDAQQLELGSCTWSDIALSVHATVVSAHGNRVIVDAGSKALGADRAAYATGFGRVMENPDARIVALSEHHATIEYPEGATLPKRGEILSIVPNHVCNTVNLADQAFVFEGGDLVDCWQVAARGRND